MTRCQQAQVYAAESGVGRGREFASLAEVEAFALEAVDPYEWIGTLEVRAAPASGRGSCGADRDGLGRIDMHPDHWCQLYVCHELAHVVAQAEGSKAHCPVFARRYLEMVYRTMGPDAYKALYDAFAAGGVDIG